METLTIIFLVFLFFGIYFTCFYIILTIRNRKRLFYSPKPQRNYSISFLVPAFNEEKTIENTIEAIFNTNYPIKEIIVVNDGSTDRTKEVVQRLKKKYKKLKLINKENEGKKAYAINYGLKEAKGELVAITDADSYPSPDAVGKMVGFFNDENVAAVTSCVFLKEKNKFFEKIQEIEYIIMAWARKLLDFLDSVYVTNGPLSIYRKKVLIEVGGFDTKSITEDIEVTWHILSEGYQTRMSLDSKVYTTAPNKFKLWWRQRVRWGIGGIETIIKYKKFFLKKGVFGFFIIPFVLFMIIFTIFGFLLALYILYRSFIFYIAYTEYSISLRNSIIRAENINAHPTIILILTLFLGVLSFLYTSYIFRRTEQKYLLKPSKIFNRLFYMLIYLPIYPIVWFEAIYRVITKKHKW